MRFIVSTLQLMVIRMTTKTKLYFRTNIVLELDASSKLIRSHIIDQLSRAYAPNLSNNDNPLIPRRRINKGKCLTDCPVTPFISNFKRNDEIPKYESEVSVLIWGAVATITHFSGAVMGAFPLCVQNRYGLLDRMKMMGITHLKLQLAHWFTRTTFVVIQNLLILITSILVLKEEFSPYGFFIGWIVIMLQTLCGFSFGIFLFGLLQKRILIVLYLVMLELIVSSISGNKTIINNIWKVLCTVKCLHLGFFWTYHGLAPVFRTVTIALPHHAVSKLLCTVIIQKMSATAGYVWN